MNNIIFKYASYLIAMAAGAFLLWFLNWTWAGIPRSANSLKSAIPVTLSSISPRDVWIYDYHIYAVFPDEIESKREYILLLLVRKQDSPTKELPNVPSRFILKGWQNNSSEYVVFINPSKLDNIQSNVNSILLDFGGSITRQNRIVRSDNLELSSRDLNSQ